MTLQPPEAASPRSSDRYERRRQAIITAATELLNIHGAKGMRLADVAAKLGLTTTSVTYYYRLKEDLAVACFSAGIEAMNAMIAEAGAETDPADRIRALIRLFLEAQADIREGRRPPIPVFSDIRSLKEPNHARMIRSFMGMIRRVADFFSGPGLDWIDERGRMARANLLAEQLFWSLAWLRRYSSDDFPRLGERMAQILLTGLAAPGRAWDPQPLTAAGAAAAKTDQSGQEMFLGAATRLINDRGYRGASVNDIAAELNLTKGSFYHHNEAKDDLVVACFERSYTFMRGVQRHVRDLPGDEWTRLSSAAAALVEHQLSPAGPLIRTSALSALPMEIRVEMVGMSQRVSDHFASAISDGIAEGSIRPVDAFIASQMLTAAINAASDLRLSPSKIEPCEVAGLYARPLLMGLLTP